MLRQAKLIGVASGWGAPDQGCSQGPLALQGSDIMGRFSFQDRLSWAEILTPDTACGDALSIVTDICRRLSQSVEHVFQAGHFPIVIGGDHSCAIGTWSGIHRAVHADIGLIWIDAHMDSHVPETSPSGAYHGMPLASLMGHCTPRLCEVSGNKLAVDPRHVCLLGVRSYEPDEVKLLNTLGVRVISMKEIHDKGLDWAWQEALTIASRDTVGYGITLDLDAIDPQDAPGVGSPEAGGIRGQELMEVLHGAAQDSRLLALEIAEYNPALDNDAITLTLMARLIHSMLHQDDHHE